MENNSVKPLTFTSYSDIIAKEENALDALTTIFSAVGSPKELLIHEGSLNYTTISLSWKDNFGDYKADFLTAVRNIIDVTRTNYLFEVFCKNNSVQHACKDLTKAFSNIFKLTIRYTNCWGIGPQRRGTKYSDEDFLQVLSNSFGKMLFSQSYLVFRFGNDI